MSNMSNTAIPQNNLRFNCAATAPQTATLDCAWPLGIPNPTASCSFTLGSSWKGRGSMKICFKL